jgi:hypothetical protein
MAKELPYFKFEPNQWENGMIQLCSLESKGLFIEICCLYWSRLGDLPYALALQKLCKGDATALQELEKNNIYRLEEENITIDFLDEQLNEFQKTSNERSKAAHKRWSNRDKDTSAMQLHSKSNAIREEERREDKKRKENKIPPLSEFLEYGFEKEKNLDKKSLELKYDAWVTNGWKDGNQKKIINWKSKLLNTIPHLPKKTSLAESIAKHRKIQL